MPPSVPDTWRLGQSEDLARVAIVGCGGAGCNTLRHVVPPANAERVALNDAPHPSMAGLPRRLLVSSDSLHAYASMDEKSIPTLATNEEKDISNALVDKDLVLLLGGLGGELGGWAMALVGRVARIMGDASLVLATIPFTAEGMLRRQAAEAQLELLRKRVDGVVTFGNDELLRFAPKLPLVKAFAALGAIMAQPTTSLPAVLSRSDVVPLKRMFVKAKEWRFGMGAGTEKHRSFLAVDEAYHSPWFTGRPEDVRQVIILIGGPRELTVDVEVLHEIRLRSPMADVAWGLLPVPTQGDRVWVHVLAGLDTRLGTL
jgi:cell division protein FtsZ